MGRIINSVWLRNYSNDDLEPLSAPGLLCTMSLIILFANSLACCVHIRDHNHVYWERISSSILPSPPSLFFSNSKGTATLFRENRTAGQSGRVHYSHIEGINLYCPPCKESHFFSFVCKEQLNKNFHVKHSGNILLVLGLPIFNCSVCKSPSFTAASVPAYDSIKWQAEADTT